MNKLYIGVICLSPLLAVNAFAAAFQGISNPLDPNSDITVNAISANGSTVVGYYYDGTNNVGFRWTRSAGAQGLGAYNGTSVRIYSVNGDGTILGGATDSYHSLLWEQGVGYTTPNLTGDGVQVLSADGTVKMSLSNYSTYRATGVTGGTDIGKLSGSYWTAGQDMTPDGSTIVGDSFYSNSTERGFIYKQGQGLSAVPLATGWASNTASAISSNGAYIVGEVTNGNGNKPYFWSAASGSVLLSQDLPALYITEATAVTNDGLIFSLYSSGNSYLASVHESYQAPEQDLKTWLTTKYDLGTALAGWQLSRVVGSSADGKTFFGQGSFNGVYQGWVVDLNAVPEPATIPVLTIGLAALVATSPKGRRKLHPLTQRPR